MAISFGERRMANGEWRMAIRTAALFATHHSPFALGIDVELHALRQRQGSAEIDRVGGPAHIGLPGVGAGLAAAAGLLLAAEGAADLGAGRADVAVGDAAIG